MARTTMPFGGRGPRRAPQRELRELQAPPELPASGFTVFVCGFFRHSPLRRQAGSEHAFRSGRSESLGNGLLPAASSASASTAAAASAHALRVATGGRLCGRAGSACGLFARPDAHQTQRSGAQKLRARSGQTQARSPRPRARGLLRIEIRRLQRRRRRLTSLPPELSFCGAVSDRASIYACSGL